jgi:hypothetical protein
MKVQIYVAKLVFFKTFINSNILKRIKKKQEHIFTISVGKATCTNHFVFLDRTDFENLAP